jgi:hypothetical protein
MIDTNDTNDTTKVFLGGRIDSMRLEQLRGMFSERVSNQGILEALVESYLNSAPNVSNDTNVSNITEQVAELREAMVKLQAMILQLKKDHEGLTKIVEDNL